MKSLFLRIFLSFWVAQALFLVLAILVTIAMRPTRHGIENMAPQTLAEVVNAYRNEGEKGAYKYLEDFQKNQHVRAFVFDSAGRELSGRMPPPWVEETRRGHSLHRRAWLDSLLPDRFSRQALTLDGQRYTLVLEVRPGPGGPFSGRTTSPGWES